MPLHILNGDALLERFPDVLPGERIVVRECLIDGRVTSAPLVEFCAHRAEELARIYPDVGGPDYAEEVAPELKKIATLPPDADVHLWFEDDLFCQVNLWFVSHLLVHEAGITTARWVRPNTDLRLGFGGVADHDLTKLPASAVRLGPAELAALAQLWRAYLASGPDTLAGLRPTLPAALHAVIPAIDAELARRRDDHPRQLLRELHAANPTAGFGPIFRAFSAQAPIYGFGDLQVRRLLDEQV